MIQASEFDSGEAMTECAACDKEILEFQVKALRDLIEVAKELGKNNIYHVKKESEA